MSIVLALLGALRAALRTCTNLTLEDLALRQQLALLRHGSKRPRFGRLDRLLWVWLLCRWAGWRDALHLVRPETVIRLAPAGFPRLLDLEIPPWTNGSTAHRIGDCGSRTHHDARESALGRATHPRGVAQTRFDVSQRTVARLMPRRPKPPSQTWRTFLANHLADLVSVDFFVVPPATFRVLYVS